MTNNIKIVKLLYIPGIKCVPVKHTFGKVLIIRAATYDLQFIGDVYTLWYIL